MRITKLESVYDAFTCEVSRYSDQRGYFQELFSHKHLPDFRVSQINCSSSSKNVIRGLHIAPFAKLVYCVKGKIFDVVADVRKDSRTYLGWYGLELTGNNALYIPPHCAHGFLSMEDDSLVVYAQDGLYDPRVEQIVNYADPELNIKWPWPILSEKDRNAPLHNVNVKIQEALDCKR